ncbi:hypothetical protein ACTJJB_01790 [Chitinophaga sp. 22536]|uniref:hypothetical protein n=1 Tax=unclassified Chitinophaga TaxID=2619133 RepID=UPI003F85343F
MYQLKSILTKSIVDYLYDYHKDYSPDDVINKIAFTFPEQPDITKRVYFAFLPNFPENKELRGGLYIVITNTLFLNGYGF